MLYMGAAAAMVARTWLQFLSSWFLDCADVINITKVCGNPSYLPVPNGFSVCFTREGLCLYRLRQLRACRAPSAAWWTL